MNESLRGTADAALSHYQTRGINGRGKKKTWQQFRNRKGLVIAQVQSGGICGREVANR